MKHQAFKYNIGADVAVLVARSGVNINSLRGKRILVTGGTGFFGVWILSALNYIKLALDGDLQIFVITRSPEPFLEKALSMGFSEGLEIIKGDVRNAKLEVSGITHLLHMATTNAKETFEGEDQLNKLSVLYDGTKNVLEQCGTSLENVLFTSSGVTYGACQKEKIAENEPCALDTTEVGTSLAIGKLAAEYIVTYYANKFGYKYSIARCFTFAGQHLPLDLHYAFGNFIQNSQADQDIVIRGDGQDCRSYLYIGDAVGWLLRMLMEPKNQVINVGSERILKIKDLAELIASRAGVGVRVLGVAGDVVGNFRRANYVPDTSKAKFLYPGLDEWTPVEEIVQKMLSSE